MRELTFEGFLTRYVHQLSREGTNSVYKLAKEAGTDNPRLREPLALYASWKGKESLLLQAAKQPELRNFYAQFFATFNRDSLEKALEQQDPTIPEEYRKVWRSYQSMKNRLSAEDHTKELMRGKLKRIQEKKRISNYRIYTDLHMNPGNLNAWLKHGDSGKVSLATARKALQYVESV